MSKTSEHAQIPPHGGAPVLRVAIPGALMFQFPQPAGLPDPHTIRSAHLHVTETSSAFACLVAEERTALFESLAEAFRRSEYHRIRFLDVLQRLPERRALMPGYVFWDELVEFLHFELQAYCGAARSVLDQVVYLIARAHSVPPKKAREKPWEPSSLVGNTKPLPTACRVPEVRLLAATEPWFELLNAYRNSFVHGGWRHGRGHFEQHEQRAASREPAANALILPDPKSLTGRKKPHEWTYAQGLQVDEVMRKVREGLDDFLKQLCEGPWGTPEPAPGTIPREEQPNVMVWLAHPVIYEIHGQLAAVAFFTTRDKAMHPDFRPGPDAEPVQVPVVGCVINQTAATFSLRGASTLSSGVFSEISVLLDPVFTDNERRNVTCIAKQSIDVATVVDKPELPVNLTVDGMPHLFAWVRKWSPGWR